MPSNRAVNDITGVILAGGRARRMGGMDKGLIKLAGKPLVEHVIAVLEPQVGGIVISANRNRDAYAAYGYQVIADTIGNNYGPLAGMLSAMRAVDTPFILCVPCDAPVVSTDLVKRLYATLNIEDADVCVAHDGTRMQPVFALLRCGLADDLNEYLSKGGREVTRWMRDQDPALADFSDEADAFFSANTVSDLQILERLKQTDIT